MKKNFLTQEQQDKISDLPDFQQFVINDMAQHKQKIYFSLKDNVYMCSRKPPGFVTIRFKSKLWIEAAIKYTDHYKD